MEYSAEIIFSNYLEQLFEKFAGRLFADTDPFCRRIVLVSGPGIKKWLTLRMAEHPRLGIAAGIEIYSLEEGFKKIYGLTCENPGPERIPTEWELSLKIEVEIRKILKKGADLSEEEASLEILIHYLQGKEVTLSPKGEKRLFSLCEKLSTLFFRYGHYGGAAIDRFEKSEEKNWQAHIWRSVFCHPSSGLTYPRRQFNKYNPKKNCENITGHIFAVNYISPEYIRFLKKFAEKIPVFHYILSPCSLFWSDICSDKQRISMRNYWHEKGVSFEEESALEELLKDRNPLLANLGRLGREIAKEPEILETDFEEFYIVNEKYKAHEIYSDYYFEEYYTTQKSSFTLLDALQTDILLLRNPDGAKKIDFVRDLSVRVDIAPGKLREVEILYDNLLKMVSDSNAENNPIKPSDIRVYAPEIKDYEPYIRVVFGRVDSCLECRILTGKPLLHTRVVKLFLYILSLNDSKWSSKDILKLFEFPEFLTKNPFSHEDKEMIRLWIRETGISWGETDFHRDRILEKNHCTNGMIDKRSIGTWESGFEKLYKSMVITNEEKKSSTAFSNFDRLNIEFTQIDTLGRFSGLINSLRADLSLLSDGTCMTLHDWSLYLECMIESYIASDPLESQSENDYLFLLEAIQSIKKIDSDSEKFSYCSVASRLESLLSREREISEERALHGVTFSSLKEGYIVPGKIIALIGMCEEDFPKKDLDNSLNALQQYTDTDFCPRRIDFDRYHFLEILLSVRRYLCLSYANESSEGTPKSLRSSVVSELLDYMDSAYTIDGNLPSEVCTFVHPFYSFDKKYFDKKSGFTGYSLSNYRAAQAFYSVDKKEPYTFIESFSIKEKKDFIEEEDSISVNDLSNCVKNPLKVFFNRCHGIYLSGGHDKEIKDEENFSVSLLDSAIIKKAALRNLSKDVLESADRTGKLPLGMFGRIVKGKILRDSEVIVKNFENFGINFADVFTIELSPRTEVITYTGEGVLTVPAVKIRIGEKSVSITGILRDVCNKGLLTYTDDKSEEVIKYWPEYIVLSYLIEKYDLPIKPNLFPMKSGKGIVKSGLVSGNEQLLHNFVQLFFLTAKYPSPLLPERIPGILEGNINKLEHLIKSDFSNPFRSYSNAYSDKAFPFGYVSNSCDQMPEWRESCIECFGGFYEMWYSKVALSGVEESDDE